MLPRQPFPAPGSARSVDPPRVVQAYFPRGLPPAKLTAPSSPHPAAPPRPALGGAKIAQKHPASGPVARPPHPAKASSPGQAFGGRPPHAAKQRPAPAQPFMAPHARPPHPAQRGPTPPVRPQAAQPAMDTHAWRAPQGLLEGGRGREGNSMPAPVQQKMEDFFGVDFSDVRVHVGHEAPAIGALAFTLGSDIYFAPGQYEPLTQRGQELLGHELTHVVQQRDGRVANPFGAGVAVVQDPELEAEADRMGALAAQPRPVSSRPKMKAAQPRAAQPKGASLQQRPAAESSYKLVIGAYMHQDENAKRLPEELAGHSFVSIKGPRGTSETWGFSPANFGGYDPNRDLAQLKDGVAGVVHSDEKAFEKPGVKTREFPISEAQAQAAMAKVAEYQSGEHAFSLEQRQCSTFALDVLRAAKVDALPGASVRRPWEMYRELS